MLIAFFCGVAIMYAGLISYRYRKYSRTGERQHLFFIVVLMGGLILLVAFAIYVYA